MDKEYYQKHVFSLSLIITIVIFASGILISYSMDFFRVDSVDGSIREHQFNREVYLAEKEFMDTFGEESCESLRSRVFDLRQELSLVGADLTAYGTKALFKKKDFDYLKRKYFLLEMNFFNLVNKVNENCEEQYNTILFFYEIDDTMSERQGYVLEELNDNFGYELIILSFDIDYKDDDALNLLKLKFNVTTIPTLIVNNEIKLEGIQYVGQISAIF